MTEGDKDYIILEEIARENNLKIRHAAPLAGGDINEVFKITTVPGETFVVKLNDPKKFPKMFEAEKTGLDALRNTTTFTIPKVIALGIVKSKAYLLLDFIDSSSPAKDFWNIFGRKLAELHKFSDDFFGFNADNYIGSLPQQNGQCTTASEFYISQRLEPQIRLAREKGFDPGKTSSLFKTCSEIIPDEPPSLVHGDLWSGNYLVDQKGLPCIIDPAVSYAPREMDLAMMKLFGGFNPMAFTSYNRYLPMEEGWEERTSLWQLYYLLVHLNIFGEGYLGRVKSIIQSFS